MKGNDRAEADCDQSPYADRIWLTVKGGDFQGTVALNSDTASALVTELQSCINQIRAQKDMVKS